MTRDVKVPDLGEGVTEAQFAAWLRREGDAVTKGDEIAEVMTDKANVAIECPDTGVLRSLLAAVDDVVSVGQVIALIEVPA